MHTYLSCPQPVLLQTVSHRRVARCHAGCLASNAFQRENPVVRASVNAATELLRVIGVGRSADVAQPVSPPIAPGDVPAIMDSIRRDYRDHAYIVTGIVRDSAYDSDCYFADPTVSFRGLDQWRSNLRLLVPFLEDASVELLALDPADRDGNGAQLLKAEWRLQTYLKLPWRPLIDILGTTVYTLDPATTRVVKHVEGWNVTGTEAIAQIFKASNRSKVPFLRGR